MLPNILFPLARSSRVVSTFARLCSDQRTAPYLHEGTRAHLAGTSSSSESRRSRTRSSLILLSARSSPSLLGERDILRPRQICRKEGQIEVETWSHCIAQASGNLVPPSGREDKSNDQKLQSLVDQLKPLRASCPGHSERVRDRYTLYLARLSALQLVRPPPTHLNGMLPLIPPLLGGSSRLPSC